MTFFPPSSLNRKITENLSRGTSWSTEFLSAGELLAVTRAIETVVECISGAEGLKAGIVSRAIEHLGELGQPLPPLFCKEELETLLEIWEQQDCPFQLLGTILNLMSEATYQGSVLIDSVTKGREQVYLPTVAPWHAASFFTSAWQTHNNMPPRCAKLMDVAGSAYKNKVDAIESSNVQTMKQASSYFTDVLAAITAMFAV